MDGDDGEVRWVPWVVRPQSGFGVVDSNGRVGLVQITEDDFRVTTHFRFVDGRVESDLREFLTASGRSAVEVDEALERALTVVPSEDGSPSNLASVPQLMQWFERPYGAHTLAALIHDELITPTVDGGALGSDSKSDWLFRQMLASCDVPLIKRWIMWGATALRTRSVAGGRRLASIIVWVLCALLGLSSFVAAVVVTIADEKVPSLSWWLLASSGVLFAISGVVRMWKDGASYLAGVAAVVCLCAALASALSAGAVPGDAFAMALFAALLPFIASLLWGRQYGAGLVAAVAGLFVIPAAVFVAFGLGVYWMLEKTALWIVPEAGATRRRHTGSAINS